MKADELLAQAEREGVTLLEPSVNVLRVQGDPSQELLSALGLNKVGVLSELWRRDHWGPDYAKDWRRHCLEDWANFQPVSYSIDPREDLAKDHGPWQCLLQATEGETQGLLHGIRCLGAALERDKASWRLSHGLIDETEYRELRGSVLLPAKTGILLGLDALSSYKQWHELLDGPDWRPTLEPENVEPALVPRLWFEGKEGGLVSIA